MLRVFEVVSYSSFRDTAEDLSNGRIHALPYDHTLKNKERRDPSLFRPGCRR